MLRRILQVCLVALLFSGGVFAQGGAPAAENDASSPLRIENSPWHPGIVVEHRVTEIQPLRVAPHVFDRIWSKNPLAQITVTVVVDEKGNVLSATGDDDENKELNSAAIDRAKALKYEPFLRDGKPVSATFEEFIDVLPQERLPKHHVPFPAIRDWNSLKISFDREHHYTVEISGDGTVIFNGKPDKVFISGEHREHISPEVVSRLVDQFRRADYFSFSGEYADSNCKKNGYPVTISITFDGKSKTVSENCGQEMGMPQAVTDLEETIDKAADTERWVSGNEKTVPSLKREGYNFKSPAANKLFYDALTTHHPPLEMVRGLIAAGVSTEKPSGLKEGCVLDWIDNDPKLLKMAVDADVDRGDARCKVEDLAVAASTGDLQLVRMLIRRGFNPGAPRTIGAVGTALVGAAESGNDEMVAEILKYLPDINAVDALGRTALYLAAEKYKGETDVEQENDKAARLRIIHMLLKAGADPNLHDYITGSTALHMASSGKVALALIAGGADVNARDKEGGTPLMDNRSPEVTRVLIASGADLSIKVRDGRTVLEELLYFRKKLKGRITDEAKEQIAILQAAQTAH